MSVRVAADLEQKLIAWVNQHRRGAGGSELNNETDLLATGVLDSVGFVELLAHIEEETKVRVDVIEIDPTQLTTIAGLAQHISSTVV